MMMAISSPRTNSVAMFLGLTFVLTWVPAWLVADAWRTQHTWAGTQLLSSTLIYAASMGWQPLFVAWLIRRYVDSPGYVDQGLRPAHRRFMVLAGIAAVGLVVLAVGLASLFEALGARGWLSLAADDADRPGVFVSRSWAAAAGLVVALLATGALVWAQCLAEEVGWRGFLLTRLIQRFGALRGLFLHGVFWGLWYAPILLLASADLSRSVPRSAGFILTCCLLGVLFGWLRLRANSVLPATLANAILTLAAGLPLLIQGLDVGLRGAVYGPAGWLVMALAIAAFALGRRGRGAPSTGAATQSPPAHDADRRWLVFDEEGETEEPRGPRVLH